MAYSFLVGQSIISLQKPTRFILSGGHEVKQVSNENECKHEELIEIDEVDMINSRVQSRRWDCSFCGVKVISITFPLDAPEAII